MGLRDREMIEDRGNVVGGPGLRLRAHLRGNIGRSKSARRECNSPISLAEVANLRFPTAVIAGKFVDEYNGYAGAGFFVVQPDLIVRYRIRHCASSFSALVPDRPAHHRLAKAL
jgi:hypothetical protein